MQSMYLQGSEDVRSAGNTMSSAADTMSRAASTMDTAADTIRSALYNHECAMSNLVDRLENIVKEGIQEAGKVAVANDRVLNAWSHLKVALAQSIPSDDQTIMGHVRTAAGLLDPNVREMPPAPAAPLPECDLMKDCCLGKGHSGACSDLPF